MIFLEYPQTIYVKGITTAGFPIIREFLITPDGKIRVGDEYPKKYKKEKKR